MEKLVTFKGWLLPLALVFPQILISAVFFFYPAGQAIWQSLFIPDPFGLSSRFVGLGNFEFLFTDEFYRASFFTTAIFSGLVTFSGIADALSRSSRLKEGSLLRRLSTPRWAWALCALPLLAGVLQFSVDLKRKGLRLQIPLEVPVEACEFLRRHDLGPKLLLRFDWGGYAIWHLYPEYRVSGDGRNLTVYDAEFVDGLLRAYDGGTELSGGQWQRVALARTLCAVARGARLVLLDEPTAQLDVRGEAEIFDRVLEATRDVTTILISHRFSTVRHADLICVLEQGRVVELGSHDELMTADGRYRQMFELQASRFENEEGLESL